MKCKMQETPKWNQDQEKWLVPVGLKYGCKTQKEANIQSTHMGTSIEATPKGIF